MGPNKVVGVAMLVAMILVFASVIEFGEASRAVKSHLTDEPNSEDCLECSKACTVLPECNWFKSCGHVCSHRPVADGVKAVKPLIDCDECMSACFKVPICDCTWCQDECPGNECQAPPTGKKH